MAADQLDEADILAFALRWYPYGGGSNSDIFVRFGIMPSEYFARLRRVLASPHPDLVNGPGIRAAMQRICDRRTRPA